MFLATTQTSWAKGRAICVTNEPESILFAQTGMAVKPSHAHATRRKEGADMKILQVVPKPGTNSKLKTMLKNTERNLRGPHTTFHRMREGRWKHVKYPGWIEWDEAAGGLLAAEIHTKVKDHEWQMMDAFIGYLDRHLGEQIESISIYYR